MSYNVRQTHMRDIYGRLLWVEEIQNDYRLYQPGDTFVCDEIRYRVERIALVENTQHVNLAIVEEDVNIGPGPHL